MLFFCLMIYRKNKKIYNESIDSIKIAYDSTIRPEIYEKIIKKDYNTLFKTSDKVDFKIMISDLAVKSQNLETFEYPVRVNKKLEDFGVNTNVQLELEKLNLVKLKVASYFKFQYIISFMTILSFLTIFRILMRARFSPKLLKYQVSKNHANVKYKLWFISIFTCFLYFFRSKKFQSIMFKFEHNNNALMKYKEFKKYIENN